jgi:acetate kinase
MKKILVLNSGSSSIKVKIFDEKYNVILEALLERIFIDGKMEVEYNGEEFKSDHDFKDHDVALTIFFDFLKEKEIIKNFDEEILVTGHRVVMGGKYDKAVLINDETLKYFESVSNLAPLHNPANLAGVKKMIQISKAPNVAVCDTAFHQTMDIIKFIYPLPYDLYEKDKIRKYGYHGTSYEYTTKKFIKETNIKNPNLIIFHLGNGSSVAAIKDGKSVNTSMGLTPLSGIMMGTRTGDIDPAIAEFLQTSKNLSGKEVNDIFNKKSGLLGLSKKSNDMREITTGIEAGDKNCILAFNVFVDRIVDHYSKYLNDIDNKIDGLIFTAGIGYNNKGTVNEIINKIKISNIELEKG